MTTVMSTSEWCELAGSDRGELEESIREAEADAITAETMDPDTFRWLKPGSEKRAREILRNAGHCV